MLSVADAQKTVLQHVRPLAPVVVSLSPHTLGSILAENIASDLDMPPFDKAMMDGFALRTQDLHEGVADLSIIEEIMAGKSPALPIREGQTARIMTGAPVPQGADAVVMVERSTMLASDRVRIQDPRVKSGQNILTRGREMHAGEIVLERGARLRPQEFGLLATVGRTTFAVHPAPRVAIVSTGDELVEPDQKPGSGQIRNSNGPMLLAQASRAGGVPLPLGIARDEPEHLRSLIAEGLLADVLLLSGGVSAGKLDLVPGILTELGVTPLFHKVAMKPGKPVLFGIKPRQTNHEPPHLIFGLPGNPVSSLVCFELFVRRALRGLMGLHDNPGQCHAALAKDFPYRSDRPTYHPARLVATATGWSVEAVPWFGSPDLRSVVHANAFVLLPAGDHQHRAGQWMEVLRLEFA